VAKTIKPGCRRDEAPRCGVNLTLAAHEREALKALARQHHLSFDSFVRSRVLSWWRKDKPRRVRREVYLELVRIRNNLDRLVLLSGARSGDQLLGELAALKALLPRMRSEIVS